MAAPAAGHVQDVSRQEAVHSNNTRFAVIEAAIETLASFQTQLVDLQQKVSTIEVPLEHVAGSPREQERGPTNSAHQA
jgi:hypothetical protein